MDAAVITPRAGGMISPPRLARGAVASLAIGGGSLMISGALLPWLSLYAGVDTLNGIDGVNGWVLIAAGGVAIAAASTYLWRPSEQLRWGLAGLGFIASAFAAWVVSQLLGSYQQLQGDPFVVASLGMGAFVALAGGLLVLGTLLVPHATGASAERGARAKPVSAPGDARRLLLTAVIALLVSVAMIHLAVVGPHLQVSALYAAFFICAAFAQIGAALVLTVNRGRRLLLAVALGNGLIIVVWAISRTVGLPIGPTPGVAEGVSLPDVLASVGEGAIVALSVMLARAHRPLAMKRWVVDACAVTVGVAATAMTVIAIVGVQAGGG